MFIGNWLVNVISAFFAFIIVFSASYFNNLISTTLIRATIAFVVTYLVVYLFRWLAYLAFHTEGETDSTARQLETNQESERADEPLIETASLENKEIQLTKDDVLKTTQYVKDLLENEEG